MKIISISFSWCILIDYIFKLKLQKFAYDAALNRSWQIKGKNENEDVKVLPTPTQQTRTQPKLNPDISDDYLQKRITGMLLCQ